MDKRTFLRNAAFLLGAATFPGIHGCSPRRTELPYTSEQLKNWAQNLQFSTTQVYQPSTVTEIQSVVNSCAKLRVLGSRHSFNTIADSNENLLSFKKLNQVITLDPDKKQITVEGGITYGELSKHLHENGYALPNLASLPHITVAGSISTGTHGSGVGNGNLSTSVSAIEFIDGQGEIVTLSDQDPAFQGAVVALGGLGPFSKVTLAIEPTFEVAQVVYLDLPMDSLKDHFVEIMSSGYSVSLFIDWTTTNVTEVWVKKKVISGEETVFPDDFFGAKKAKVKMHPVPSLDPESCSEQLGLPGPWFERLPHFKMEFQPSAGKELQSEYFVPIEAGYQALSAVAEISDQISPHLFISEIRSIKADEFWMSPCFQRDSIAIHTTWKQEIPEVMALLPIMEEKLSPFNPRPHWAKLFTIPFENLASRYPKIEDFKKLLLKYDPEGKFRNEFMNAHVFGSEA